MNFAVVIPSRNIANLEPCINAIQKREPTLARFASNICIVDDDETGTVATFAVSKGMRHVIGAKPFIFAQAANSGLRHVFERGYDSAILLNDDALLQTPGGFTLLAQAINHQTEYGVIAASSNHVGNTNQYPQNSGLRSDPRMVCFVCVVIPHRTWVNIGPLDERFTAYGHDDDDYCKRIRMAGGTIGIHDNCYVDHGSLTSTFRADPYKAAGDLAQNALLFQQKWGEDNWGNKVGSKRT